MTRAYAAEYLEYSQGSPEQWRIALAAPADIPDMTPPGAALPAQFTDRLEEIGETWQILTDERTGQRFEVCQVNTGQPTDGCVAEISSFSSSIVGSPGAALELAFRGMARPSQQRVYVATMGNGYTNSFSPPELSQYAATGLLTDTDKGSYPTIDALCRVLEDRGFGIQEFSATSFGVGVATAMMTRLAPGQVRHAYMMSRPNLSDRTRPGLVLSMTVVEDILHKNLNRWTTTDQWAQSAHLLEATKRHLPKIYDGSFSQAITEKGFMLKYLQGLTRGPRHGDPALVDTVAALSRQPGAQMTFDVPNRDPLYTRLSHAREFLGRLAASGRIDPAKVRLLVTRGTHAPTFQPQQRAATERFAYGS